jgi:hypothetical protein
MPVSLRPMFQFAVALAKMADSNWVLYSEATYGLTCFPARFLCPSPQYFDPLASYSTTSAPLAFCVTLSCHGSESPKFLNLSCCSADSRSYWKSTASRHSKLSPDSARTTSFLYILSGPLHSSLDLYISFTLPSQKYPAELSRHLVHRFALAHITSQSSQADLCK